MRYYIENYDSLTGNTVIMIGSHGQSSQSSGTPAIVVWECDGVHHMSGHGWTVHGVATVKNFPTYAASHAAMLAPGVVAVTVTDGHGDAVKITGADVANNYLSLLVAGSFKIVETFSDGDKSACTINQTGGNSAAQNQMEY